MKNRRIVLIGTLNLHAGDERMPQSEENGS